MKNITINQFIKLSEDKQAKYHFLKFQKGCNTYAGKTINFTHLPFVKVRNILTALTRKLSFDDTVELIGSAFDIPTDKIGDTSLSEFLAAKAYIEEQANTIRIRESKIANNSGVDLVKWQTAGGAKLAPFDTVLTLHTLGEKYGKYPFDLGQKPYAEIMYLYTAVRTYDQVCNEYTKLK